MEPEALAKTVERLVAKPKGLLAIDESTRTCTERFEKLGVESTEETRREYRELIVTTPDLEKYISGLILVEETLGQKTRDGKPFKELMESRGMQAGIKVDGGTEDAGFGKNEKVTKGLDGLHERLEAYRAMGAVFAKWRSVYTIGESTPSNGVMQESAERFATYATLCQSAGIVPIVEPEILMEGSHDISKCAEVTAKNLDIVFAALREAGVHLPGMILKTSMVTSGGSAPVIASVSEVAKKTLEVLIAHVPSEVGGVVFLSGGQYDEIATLHLEAMKEMRSETPWPLTFSFGRAIQQEGLKLWAADRMGNWQKAQDAILDHARANSLASMGEYTQ